MSPLPSRTAHRARLTTLIAATLLAPVLAWAEDEEPTAAPELVAEALFLYDALPPGGRDLNFSVAVTTGEPDPVTGETTLSTEPRMQLAMAINDRLGFTADVGIGTDDGSLQTPAASLKLLLRAPDAETTGIAASLDLFGSTQSFAETEAGLGLGAIRSFGRVALRVAASVASGISSWSPHLHAGASAALALGARWRALAEVVTEVSGGQATLAAGPTIKVALAERTALMAGALFPASPDAPAPVFTFQLTQSM
jgi:hypothetical protein